MLTAYAVVHKANRTLHGDDQGFLFSPDRVEIERRLSSYGDGFEVVELREVPAGTKTIVRRAVHLNDSAVQALVKFFQDTEVQSKTFDQLPDETAIYLAVALGVDPAADRDTIEMAIRHALTKSTG